MNRYVRAVLAGAAGLLLVLAAPVPATAADPLWPDTASSCATGQFTSQVTGPADQDGPFLELSGWVEPCPPDAKDPAPVLRGRFGFAYFVRGLSSTPGPAYEGSLSDSRLRAYQSETGRTTFVGRFNFDMVRGDAEGGAICLMRDPTTRVACAVVGPDLVAPSATWVPVTAPRVQGRVTVFHVAGHPWPNCGTCL